MSISAKLKGLDTNFFVIGEASRLNIAYVEPEYSNTVFPVVKHVGFEERAFKGALVHEVIDSSGLNCFLITMQKQFETLFMDFKTRQPVVHLKPERSYGYVMNYLDIRIAKSPNRGDEFTWESYQRLDQKHGVFLFADYDEIDFPEKNIPRLIREAPGPVYVSTRKRNLSIFEGATAVIVSEKDFKSSYNEVSNLIVTLGGDGASFNGEIFKTEKHTSGDNFGCRETFFAFFSIAHYFTRDYSYAINIANRAASNVAKVRSLPKSDSVFNKSLYKEVQEYSVSK
jgi:hypothetical protein